MALFETLQAVVNKVYNEFIVKGRDKAQNMDGDCMYRGGGLATSDVRCALGVCIPDELYLPAIEGHSPDYIEREYPTLYDAVFNSIPAHVLSHLQSVHDNSTDTDNMAELLTEFVKEYALTLPKTK